MFEHLPVRNRPRRLLQLQIVLTVILCKPEFVEMATIRGTSKKDRLTGTGAKDTISGLAGDDVLLGAAGNDTLKGASGNDQLFGGSGKDKLFGGAGNDKLKGDSGDDTLDGGSGIDRLEGGSGNDIYVVRDTGDVIKDTSGTDLIKTSVTLRMGSGTDLALAIGSASINITGNALDNIIVGNAGNNVLAGGAGNDVLSGGSGNDTLNGGTGNDAFAGGAGNDIFNGGDGIDTVIYSDSTTSGVGVNLDNSNPNSGDALGDTFTSIENAIGSNQDDIIRGDGNDNALAGLLGSDSLFGLGGNDTLIGGDGADDLSGGTGFNIIDPGTDTQTDRIRLDPNGVASFVNFEVGEDLIVIDRSDFGNFGGTLADGVNYIQGNGVPPADYGVGSIAPLLYVDFSSANGGDLYFDVDGNGVIAPVLVATSLSFTLGVPASSFELTA